MTEWPIARLGDVAEVVMGQSPPGSTLNVAGEGTPFYQGAKDFGWRYPSRRVFTTGPTRLAKPGDVLISVRAPVGRVNRAKEPCSVGRGVAALRGKEDADTDFLEYLLRALEDEWSTHEAAGSVFSNLGKDALLGVKVVWPPSPERRAIVAVLGAFDDKVELNRHVAATAASAAASLYDVLLSNEAGGMVTLPDVATFVKGVSYRSADLRDDGPAALVTLKSIGRAGDYREEGLKPFDGPHKPDQRLMPGDVVVAQTDLTQRADVLGRAVRVPGHPGFERLIASLDLVVVRPSVPSVSPEFLYTLLARRDFREHARSYANGTTVLHLSKQAFTDYTFPLPSDEDIQRFTEAVAPLLALDDQLAVETRTLSAMRDLLLPKLISGELRVRDAEALVESAT